MFSIYLSQKFDPSSCNDLSVQNFDSHVSGESPILAPQDVVKIYFFFVFAYSENFKSLACVVKKLQFYQTRFGDPHFSTYKFCQFLSFLCVSLITLKISWA